MWKQHQVPSEASVTLSEKGEGTKRKTPPTPPVVPQDARPTSQGTPISSPTSIAHSTPDASTYKLFNGTVKSAYVWDVRIPPAVNSIQGHFFPKILHPNRERRISVEVRAPDILPSQPDAKSEDLSHLDFTVVRIFVLHTSKEAKVAHAVLKTGQHAVDRVGKTATTAAKNVKDASAQVIQASKRAVDESKPRDDGTSTDQPGTPVADDASVSTLGLNVDDDGQTSIVSSASLLDKHRTAPASLKDLLSIASTRQAHWVEKYCLLLDDIAINKRVKNICVVTTTHETADGEHKKMKTREIIFANEREAVAFDRLVRGEKKMAAQRSRKRLKDALGNGKISPAENVKILAEIVSAWDLAVGDMFSSDPYVVVRMGEREIHRTQYRSKT